jgi:hypothetical protein
VFVELLREYTSALVIDVQRELTGAGLVPGANPTDVEKAAFQALQFRTQATIAQRRARP